MNETLIMSLVLCLIFGLLGNYLGHRFKKIPRGRNLMLAIGILWGFAAFLIFLILRSYIGGTYWHLPEVSISFLYSYFMSNARYFEDYT